MELNEIKELRNFTMVIGPVLRPAKCQGMRLCALNLYLLVICSLAGAPVLCFQFGTK